MKKTPALFKQARGDQPDEQPEGSGFKKPDVKGMVPPAQRDAVERIVAAGMRYLYSPEMRPEVIQAIQSQEPMPQKLAGNVAGLILTLDSQAQGGLPVEAMFPAGVELLGEAAEVVTAAGQPVTQEDFNTAALVLMATLAKKLGANDEQITQAMQGGGAPSGPGEEPMDDTMPENAA